MTEVNSLQIQFPKSANINDYQNSRFRHTSMKLH